MKWRGRERSSNIEDRRRAPQRSGGAFRGGLGSRGLPGGGLRIPMGRGGGIGGIIGVIVIVGLFWVLTGENPLDSSGTSGTSGTSAQSWPAPSAGEDELADFVGVVVKETENLWAEVFLQNDLRYTPATVVLFSGATQSGCGLAQAASGPFYCPGDQKVYIDLSFYDRLRERFGAPGDFAQAYVIAHEIGHHVQELTGVLPDFNRRRPTMSQAQRNAHSVLIELQADCYAGIWANYAGREDLLERGDFEEAMQAANSVGDDKLSGGQASPRDYTHGSSSQRMSWFRRGFETGDVGQCDTFSGA